MLLLPLPLSVCVCVFLTNGEKIRFYKLLSGVSIEFFLASPTTIHFISFMWVFFCFIFMCKRMNACACICNTLCIVPLDLLLFKREKKEEKKEA